MIGRRAVAPTGLVIIVVPSSRTCFGWKVLLQAVDGRLIAPRICRGRVKREIS